MARAKKIEGDEFGQTFAALRKSLLVYSHQLLVAVDKPGDFQLCSRTLKDRIGRPLFVAGVQIKKNYVSYHLMALYMNPTLQAEISPALRKRMSGKSCFNFTKITPKQIQEVASLTRTGLEIFNKFQLPWDKAEKRSSDK